LSFEGYFGGSLFYGDNQGLTLLTVLDLLAQLRFGNLAVMLAALGVFGTGAG
jgi:hypothetical protein